MFFGSVWFSTPVFNTGFQRRFTTDSREKRFGIGLVSLCYRSYFSLIAVSCFFTHQDPFNTFSILDILHPTCSFFSTSKDLRAQRNIDGAHSGCKTTIRINVVCWKCNKPGRWIGSQCYRMLSKVAPFNYSIILISYCVCVCVHIYIPSVQAAACSKVLLFK